MPVKKIESTDLFLYITTAQWIIEWHWQPNHIKKIIELQRYNKSIHSSLLKRKTLYDFELFFFFQFIPILLHFEHMINLIEKLV